MKLTKKIKYVLTVMSIAVMAMPFSAYATTAATTTASSKETADLDQVVEPVTKLITNLLNPLLALVGAGGALFCVFLGVKYAKAEDPQEHEKAKKALKNAIIGFVLIFVLILALRLAMPKLGTWVEAND